MKTITMELNEYQEELVQENFIGRESFAKELDFIADDSLTNSGVAYKIDALLSGYEGDNTNQAKFLTVLSKRLNGTFCAEDYPF